MSRSENEVQGNNVDTALDEPAAGPSCACGSGLHAAACCDLDSTRPKAVEPLSENRRRLEELTAARQRVDQDTAVRLAIDILSEQPTVLEALAALFLIRRSQGNRTAARALIRRLVVLGPQESRFTTYLVDGLLEDKAFGEAEAAARKVVRMMPLDPRGHDTLGLVFSVQLKLTEGEFHLRRALELGDRRAPRLLMHLGNNVRAQGRLDDARALYEEVLELTPVSLETMLALAELEDLANNAEQAEQWLSRMEAIAEPLPAPASRLKARMAYRRGELDLAMGALNAVVPSTGIQAADYYLTGQILDKLGRYDEAFAQFEQANSVHATVAGSPFNLNQARRRAQVTRTYMTERVMALLPTAAVAPGPQPLFIVGAGRSGTTMLEQSLSMHPQIMAAGELPSMSNLSLVAARLLGSSLAYPSALGELWIGDQHDQISLLRDHYLNTARRLLPRQSEGGWFTDKALSQELYLGLIHLVFPQSPIIHLVRHPLDVVASGYANALPLGGYKSGVKELAQYYLSLLETAEHLQRAIPTLKCLQVRYEDVLEDQERWTRVILDFVGEPFDPACLSFHENKRYARTVSHQQVREKLHTKSKFRYKHYLKHLGPAIEVLEPAIMRLGYSI